MEIAPGVVRRSVVGEDDAPGILDIIAPVEQLDRGEPQPFLVDVRGVRGKGSRGLATNFGDMPDIPCEPEEMIAEEHWSHHHVLREMTATPVAVIVDEHVSRMEVVDPLFLHGPFHRVGNGSHHRWGVVLLGNQVAVAIEENRGEIETLIEDRRVGRLQHDQRHLGGNVGQGVVDDVERNCVDRHRELLEPHRQSGSSTNTQVQETI